MKLLRSTFLVLGMLLLPAFLLAQDTASHTKAALVSSVDTVQAGEEFWLALRLESQPHWHTYWINPGEAGFPTELIWEEKPEGIEIADTFTWPAPVYYLQGGIVSHVYEGEVFLLLRARAAANLEAGKELVFKARADWLECDDKGCWPGGADVSLTLRSAATATVTATAQAAAGQTAEGQKADASPWAEKIAQTLAALPTALPQAWSAQAEQTSAGVYKLTLTPAIAAVASSADVSASSASASSADVAADTVGAAGLAGSAANTPNTAAQPIHFFPLSDDLSAMETAAQQISVGEGGLVTFVVRASDPASPPAVISGVLTSANGWLSGGKAPALLIEVPLGTGAAGQGGGVAGGIGIGQGGSTIGGANSEGTGLTLRLLGLALAGGLILNLMPCVFPVLGIKVLGFVQQAGSERRKVVLHGLAFTAGVLISFWVLSGMLIALRTGGAELGWGFQLQSPLFVAGLAVLLLVFGLSLSGLFDIGYGAMNVGSNLAGKSGLQGSFFSGVLATVVATPCAAPMLAPALGAALALPALSSLVVFTAIGLGLSAPYLILSAFPSLVNRLPRPGAWMETFKQFMAFLLYATVAYLLWALAGQVTEEWFLNILLGLVAIAAACWAYGRWLKPASKTRVRGWSWTIIFAALGGWLIFTPVQKHDWEPWSPERVAQLQAQGRPIYVDFTARWCATCQVNKRVVFSSDEVQKRFRQENVAMLKADWTDRNATIANELAKYGRSAVPFNLFYGSKGNPAATDPLVLPELLTPAIVLEALDTVTAKPAR